VAVDANGNVFVADWSSYITEIPHGQSGYGTPVHFGSGINIGTGIAVDSQGQIYVVDQNQVWMFAP
jgi:hypothetical protein